MSLIDWHRMKSTDMNTRVIAKDTSWVLAAAAAAAMDEGAV